MACGEPRGVGKMSALFFMVKRMTLLIDKAILQQNMFNNKSYEKDFESVNYQLFSDFLF